MKEKRRVLRNSCSETDLLATLTEFVAQSIALNYQRHLVGTSHTPSQIILCGGGASNPTLVKAISGALQSAVPDATLVTSPELGWPAHTIEPAAFAWLAFLRIHNQPGNLPSTTGARRPCVLGTMTIP